MALDKQNFTLSLGLGLDTKTDSKQLQTGLLELENAYVEKTGALRLRSGYDQLSNETLEGETITSGLGISQFNDELVLITPHHLYSYATQPAKWADKGSIISTEVNSTPAIVNSYLQASPDLAITRGVILFAWEDSRGGVRATVKDLNSGAILIPDSELNADGSRPRCFAVGQYLFVYYYDTVTNELLVRRVDAAYPSEFSVEVTVANDINTTKPFFDVALVGTSRMIVAYYSTANQLKLAYFLQNNTVGTTLQGVPDPISVPSIDPDSCLSVQSGTSSTIITFHVSWANSSTGVGTIGYYSDFTVYLAEVTVDAYASDIRNIAGVVNNTLDLFWETNDAYYYIDHFVSSSSLDLDTNTASAPFVLQRNAGLASKPFIATDSTSIMVSYQTDPALQDTVFAINLAGEIEAKILPQAAGGHTVNDSCVPGVWYTDDNYYFATGKKNRLVSDTTSTLALLGVQQIAINYNSARVGLSFQLGDSLYIPGGFTKAYDGLSATEQNFHLYPETPTAALAGAGFLLDGTYQWISQWEWIDARGQIVKSTTSVPVTFTVTSGPQDVTLTQSTLKYTAKKAPARTAVIISFYRTEAGGTIFYKVSDDTNPIYNDTTTDYVTFTDSVTDADLISRPLLNTTGGVLDNAPAPSCTVIQAAKNRLFAAGLESDSQIAYSKPFTSGESIAFADEFRKQIDAKGGKITALAEMDEKVIIFKQNAIFVLTGDGPDNTGLNGDFEVTAVSSPSIGCIEPESIVEIADGILFKSRKGIWLLTRGLQTTYIGDKVEKYNDYNISSAVSVPNLNQVRFTTTQGTTLVYDHYFKLWGTSTNQAAIAATNWQNQYVFLRSSGLVWLENPAIYADNNVPIIPTIGTQWIQLAGLSGFQRVQRALILGQYKGAHNLKVSVYYDYRESPDDVFTYNLSDNTFGTVYGDTSPYGEDDYGTLDGTYQFQLDFNTQKCESMRLVIQANYPESNGTAAFNISAVTFLLAVKKLTNRMSPSRQMT